MINRPRGWIGLYLYWDALNSRYYTSLYKKFKDDLPIDLEYEHYIRVTSKGLTEHKHSIDISQTPWLQ